MSKLAALLKSRETISEAANPAKAANPPPMATDSTGEISQISRISREAASTPNLSSELEARLTRMARRWAYTDDERSELMHCARNGPAKWAAAAQLDESRQAEFKVARLLT
jgi:hypothetical protein